MTAATEIATTVQITKVSDDTGKDGQAQWELKVKWPWMPPGARYGDTLWLDVSDFPEKPAIAVHNVIAAKSTIKGTKDGNPPHDGSRDWMWNWRILSLDGPTSGTMPEPDGEEVGVKSDVDFAPERPNGGPVDPEQDKWDKITAIKDEKIAKSMAFNAAYTLIAATLNVEGGPSPIFTADIRQLRDSIFHEVLEKPVAPVGYCYR